MMDQEQPVRSEVQHAEEILDQIEQTISGWIHGIGQMARMAPAIAGKSAISGLSRVQTVGKQAGEPARSVARRIRRDDSPQRIDLNSASAEDLTTITGIGPVLAQRIVDRRTEVGPYTSFDDLAEVRGLSKDVVKEAKKQASIGDMTENTGDESD